MAIYNSKTRRATKKTGKRNRASAPEKLRKKRRVVRKPVSRSKKVSAKRTRRLARAAVKKLQALILISNKRARVRALASKKPALKKRTRAVPKKRARVLGPKKRTRAASKKPVPKKRIQVAPKKRAQVAPKKRARAAPKKARAKAKTKAQLQRELRAVNSQLEKLRKLEQKARHEPKRSPVRTRVRRRKKEIEEARAKRALVTQGLPRSTPAEIRESREDNAARMRRRFREKFTLSKQTGQLPRMARVPRRVDNQHNIGETRQVRIMRILSPDAVEDVLYRINRVGVTMTGVYPIWHAKIVFSGLGDRMLGSGGKVLEIKGADADDQFFQTEGFDSSGVWPTYLGMMNSLKTLLEGYAETPNTIVYLHYVKLLNFSRKRS